VWSELLNIDPACASHGEMIDKVKQREFRGVRSQPEHAFAHENATGIDTVEASDKFIVFPNLDTVREARAM
jgi:hypothetical protein